MDKNKQTYIDDDEVDDTCDLDPTKICDNCCKCLELDKNYKIIKIDNIERE